MSNAQDQAPPLLFENDSTLNGRLQKLHVRILDAIPMVDRVAVVIYDASQDMLKTFINSTRSGEAITAYEFKLADSPSLYQLATSNEPRIIHEIQDVIKANSQHSNWLLKQGYRSSFTIPLYENGEFAGFVFYDSMAPSAFTMEIQRDLSLYTSLINMCISSEFVAVRSIVASVKVARDFANLRDFETGAHLERMSHFSRIIAKSVAAIHQLNDEYIEHIFLFAPLHDIGKIGIPDKILLKPGKLDVLERSIMETHVIKGYDIVKKILGDFALQHLPDSKIMINIVNCHHEFLDGSGYPNRLIGNEIPIEARIVTVADIFDALISKRPYKPIWSMQEALAELHKMVDGGKLDANCVAAIETHQPEINDIINSYQDTHEAH